MDKFWLVYNRRSGHQFGVYSATGAIDAIAAMLRDSGDEDPLDCERHHGIDAAESIGATCVDVQRLVDRGLIDGIQVRKHADPVEGDRAITDTDDARDIAAIDSALLYVVAI
jgi:hypothetical protein